MNTTNSTKVDISQSYCLPKSYIIKTSNADILKNAKVMSGLGLKKLNIGDATFITPSLTNCVPKKENSLSLLNQLSSFGDQKVVFTDKACSVIFNAANKLNHTDAVKDDEFFDISHITPQGVDLLTEAIILSNALYQSEIQLSSNLSMISFAHAQAAADKIKDEGNDTLMGAIVNAGVSIGFGLGGTAAQSISAIGERHIHSEAAKPAVAETAVAETAVAETAAAETAAAETAVAEPAAAETAVAETAVAETAAAEPAAAETAVAETAETAAAEPAAAETAVAETAEPAAAEPAVAETAVAEPAVAETAVAEPAVAETAEVTKEQSKQKEHLVKAKLAKFKLFENSGQLASQLGNVSGTLAMQSAQMNVKMDQAASQIEQAQSQAAGGAADSLRSVSNSVLNLVQEMLKTMDSLCQSKLSNMSVFSSHI